MEKEERDRGIERRKRIMPESVEKGLRLKVSFEKEPGKEIGITAYAFNREGTLLASAPVKEGQTQLVLSEAQAKRARILIGPSLEGKREQPLSISILERLHAYEPKFIFDPQVNIHELLPIPEVYWKWWLI